MKRSLLLSLALAAVATPALHANVLNRLTLTCKLIYPTTPVETHGANSMSSTSKLTSQSLTNASVLDAMVTAGKLPTKTGYTLVELTADDSTSMGFYAYNAKSGDAVQLDPTLFAGLSGAQFVTATSTSAHQTASGPVQTHTTSNTGTGSAKIFGTVCSVFFNSTTALKAKVTKNAGVNVSIPYVTTSYTAVLRGVSAATQLLDGKLVSTGSVYIATP